MMSGNPLQKLFLLTGGGGNGKGVLLAVIHALLGRRNVSSIPLGDFAESQFATAEIFGKLANICGDIDATFLERTGQIKALSGEDEIKGERKFGNPFYFEFWGKGLFSANAIPASADSSRGWTRRLELLRFPYEPDKPDRTLKARLTAPASLQAIAVRAVLALAELMERGGFLHGESASEAQRQFAMKSNPVLAWVDEEAYADSTAVYERRALYMAYRSWVNAENPGGRPLSANGFYERLVQVPGVRATNSKGRRRIWGLRLNRDVVTVYAGDDDDGPEGEGGAESMVETERLF
jgi:putative DNA primase/helicase